MGKGEGTAMKNGLTKTLAAVVVALMGAQAFASAPVVSQIPSPVITDDANPVTGSYLFIYADWLSPGSLNDYVSDDGPLANIVWSFTAGTTRYAINGAAPLIVSDSKVTPPAAKIINSQANITATGEYNPDNNVLTPTLRDTVITPLGAASGTPQGAAAGTVIASDVVTLWASDGTTAGASPTITFYTMEAGSTVTDHLSATPTPTPVHITTEAFTTANGWTSDAAIGSASYATASGLCIVTPAVGPTGASIGEWISPYALIPLADYAVWRVRLTMSTTQTTAGQVPLWDVYLQNLNTDTNGNATAGDQAYVGDFYFIDGAGSANAIKGPTTGLNQFDLWYTPASVMTPQWRSSSTGAFAPALSGQTDMRIVFRLLDAGGSYGGAAAANGTICLTGMSIDRFSLNNIKSNTVLYSLNPIVNGINGVSVKDLLGAGSFAGAGSIEDFSTNPLTITPADATNGWITEITTITPGDTNNPDLTDPAYGTGAAVVDNFPITWQSNTLYQTLVTASAPDATSETNGPDAFRIGYDAKTIEIFGDSYVTTGLANKPAMPKTLANGGGSPQTYTAFYWSHNATLSTIPNANRLRYRVEVLNTDKYDRPSTGATPHNNHGGIRFHSFTVRSVQFFGMN